MRVMDITFLGGPPPVGEMSCGRVGEAGLSGARTPEDNVVSVDVWHREREREAGRQSLVQNVRGT